MAARRNQPEPDFVDEIIADRALTNPAFPAMVENGLRFSLLVGELAERRRESGLSQTDVAARMETTQSAIARIESGEANLSINTLSRYAATLGYHIEVAAAPIDNKAAISRGA